MSAEERHGSPEFYKMLEEMADLHDKKSHDYASNDNPYGNYEFAGELACLFSHSPKDAGFVGRIGEKLYRLSNLEKDGKTPKNESVEDTERDLCVIMALWVANRRERRKQNGMKLLTNEMKYQCANCGCNFGYEPLKFNDFLGITKYYCSEWCREASTQKSKIQQGPLHQV